MDVPYFVQVEEARRIAADVVRALPLPHVEHVPLAEAHGRLLGEDLRSLVDDPPFDNSAMDGFAMRLADVPEVPATLPVQAVVAAAAHEDLAPLLPGHAVRIMTGAPMPPGADAILPIEACEVGEGEVTLTKPVRPDFIRHQGENLAKGAVGLASGVRLTPSRVGLCATMGHPTVPVQRRLRIAVIATGDELRSPGEPLLHGEVYESNSHGLVGLVRAMGHEALHRPVVHDTLDGLREALTSAAAEADMILTSGASRWASGTSFVASWKRKATCGTGASSSAPAHRPSLASGRGRRSSACPATPSAATWSSACLSPTRSASGQGPTGPRKRRCACGSATR